MDPYKALGSRRSTSTSSCNDGLNPLLPSTGPQLPPLDAMLSRQGSAAAPRREELHLSNHEQQSGRRAQGLDVEKVQSILAQRRSRADAPQRQRGSPQSHQHNPLQSQAPSL